MPSKLTSNCQKCGGEFRVNMDTCPKCRPQPAATEWSTDFGVPGYYVEVLGLRATGEWLKVYCTDADVWLGESENAVTDLVAWAHVIPPKEVNHD